ncbi:hypothetical protein [Microcoleus sp. FACHB-672]|nr:hypothetical protein [Microcoleus sp. FACHB-672]MBD2039421.1 hypothetical protein [Microcoleus sp. FACHB-672]
MDRLPALKERLEIGKITASGFEAIGAGSAVATHYDDRSLKAYIWQQDN